MDNELMIFENPEFGKVRMAEINGDPWWVAKDVADILGYRNTKDAVIKHVDQEDRKVLQSVDFTKRSQIATFEIPPRGMTFINESGLYSLIVGSDLPSARIFKRWVTSEVLPSIRKHKAYITPDKVEEILQDPDVMIRLLQDLKAERQRTKVLAEQNAEQTRKIAEMEPKVAYYDLVMATPNAMIISQIAKDYGMSAVALNQKLADLKVQYKRNNQWLLYEEYAGLGYVRSMTHIFSHYGQNYSSVQTRWTQKGRLFIYEILKKNGILPICERE